VWNVDALCAQVSTAVSSSPKESFIRIFTLGIGDEASTALCEGLAGAGNGACLMAVRTETIAARCARLLKGSRTTPITNLRVDWGINGADKGTNAKERENQAGDVTLSTSSKGNEPARIAMFKNSVNLLSTSASYKGAKPAPAVILAPHPRIQQAPAIIPSLPPGTRLIVSALITSSAGNKPIIPPFVTVHGDLSSGQKFALKVPVQQSTYPIAPPLIHTLATRRLIQDLEDGKLKPVAINANEVREEDVSKAAILRLRTEYQRTSKLASFIAVDTSQNKVISSGDLPKSLDERPSFGDGGDGGRKRRETRGGRGRGVAAFIADSFNKRFSTSTNETADKEKEGEAPVDTRAPQDGLRFQYSAGEDLLSGVCSALSNPNCSSIKFARIFSAKSTHAIGDPNGRKTRYRSTRTRSTE
jgi:hypothetical protein